MSKTIDERVVSMQFDNRNFETNARTTMSTLDKLKASLNLNGAVKGLDGINTAASKCNLSPVGNAVEGVSLKFSALQVAAVTALTNITNSAVNAGKQILHSLTVAPVSDGFREYEMTLNAIQTTMAGTGKTAAEVQEELKKLDEYADKTVYSTADMLNNLPKFTNAGVELEKATTAMIGIANATALAGGDAGKASIAFYNLGQAIGTGYLTRMDYNSINNAGIATMEWKNQMVEAAIAAGTLKKAGDDLYEAGGRTFTLQQLFIDGLQEQWASTDVLMKVFGDYGDETTAIGEKAYAAAQDIKTFSMMMDSLKATAGTGWKDTWQLIFGDLDQAKILWTGLSDFISNIITKMADFRNGILEVAMKSPFAKIAQKLNAIAEPAVKVTEALEDYEAIADRVISGEFGNLQERWDKLTELGYDWAKVQNIVNERLGSSVRHTEQLTGSQDKNNKSRATSIQQLTKMNDAELELLGFTNDEIKAFRELEEQSRKTGIPIEKLAEDIDQLSGRNLLINSFKNIAKAIGEVVTTIKTAWQDIFPPKTVDERGEQLYNLIAAFHKATTALKGLVDENGNLTETGDKIARTFKGIFAVLDTITTIAGGGLKIAFKVLTEILGYFDLNILDVTANIGDALVRFHDWIESVLDVTKVLDFIVPVIAKVINDIKAWLSKFSDSEDIGTNIVQGLLRGLGAGVSAVWDAALKLGKSILDSIKSFLGIHSPSTEMETVGKNAIDGLVIGLQNGVSSIWTTVTDIGTKLLNWVKNIDFGTIFAVGVGASMIALVSQIGAALTTLAAPFEGLGDMFEDVGVGVKRFLSGMGSNFKASAWEKRAKAMLLFALAIGVLATAVYALSDIGPTELWSAVFAISTLAVVIGTLAFVIGNFGSSGTGTGLKDFIKSINFAAIGLALVGLSIAAVAITSVVKKLGELDPEQAKQGFLGLAGIVVAMGAVFAAYGTFVKGKSAKSIGKLGGMLIKLSIAMLLMIGVIKLIGLLSEDELYNGIGVLGVFITFIGALAAITRLAGKQTSKLGGMLLKMSFALLLLIGVVKLAGTLDENEMKKGAIVMGAFIVFVSLLALATGLAGDNDISKLGSTLLAISAAMLIMVYVGKVAADMSEDQLKKGGKAIVALGAIITGLIAATRLAGDKELKRVGTTLLMMSISMGIMAGLVALLGLLKEEHLKKGLTAIGVLGAVITAMIWATKGAQDCKGNIIAITVAIAVIAAAVATLSLIDTTKLLVTSTAMALLMAMFATIAKSASNINGAMGSLIVMGVVVALLAGIIYVLSGLPVDGVIASAAGLSILLLSLSASMAIISKVSGLSASAMIGMVAMVGVVALLAVVLGALTALDCAPSIETAAALSLMLAAMAGIFVVLGLTGGLAGTAIAGAVGMMAVIAIIGGIALAIGGLMSLIPAEKVEEWKTGLKNFMDFIVILATGLGEAIGGLIGGALSGISDGINDIAGCLGSLTEALGPFAAAAKTIDSAALTGVKTLVEMITSITGASVLDAIASWVTGSSSMDQFASSLKTFGNAIVAFSESVAGKINMDAVEAAGNAGRIMTALQASIPEDKWFDGKISIDDFGKKIKKFGKAIVDYSEEVADLDTAAISVSYTAASQLVTIAQKISMLDVDKLGDFNDIKKVGKALGQYSDEVADIDPTAITTSISAANRLINLVNSMSGIDTGGVSAFKRAISSLGKANLDGFVETFSKATPTITTAGTNLVDFLVKGIKSRQNDLPVVAYSLISTIATALRSKAALFQVAGIECISKFINGISKHRTRATAVMKTVASSAASAPRAYYYNFYQAGSYLVTGFANGISANAYRATAKARAMAKAAEKAAKDELRINSPSKVFYEIGAFAGEGFVNAFSDYESTAYKAGSSVADYATQGLTAAASRINDIINSDLDAQPVIRPVLDLSDVESGAGAIGGMFGSSSIGLSTVGTINTMMNRRSQNVGNGDVVNAIDKLRKDLGNVGNTSYNISGITYDRGSELDDAFRTIVRYARIEGRV